MLSRAAAVLLVCLVAGLGPVSGRAGTAPAETGDLPALIQRLGDSSFARREAAQEALVAQGHLQPEATLTACVAAYADQADPEVRFRLRAVMARLVGDHLFRRPRGFLGIQYIKTLVVSPAGAVAVLQVQGVTADSGAAKAGVLAGDQIEQADHLKISAELTVEEFVEFVQGRRPGDKMQLTLRRGGEAKAIEVELGDIPKDLQSQWYTPPREKAFFEQWLAKRLEQRRR